VTVMTKPKATPLGRVLAKVLAMVAPPPKLTVSEWADKFRVLSEEASAEPGRWVTSRAEYQRGMQDATNDPRNEKVVIVASSQVGKTEMLNNVVGFTIAEDPCPMLLIQPTLDMAQVYSKDRLAPMVRDTPCLKGKIAPAKSKDSDNTILHKQFPGGHISMVGANSPAGLASRPIRKVLADEIDRYEASAGGEGDPMDLAIARTKTFHNKMIILVSTPTEEGSSRIDAAYKESDQREFYVPCPECGKSQTLKWAQVKWPKGEKGEHLTAETYYECAHCQAHLGDGDLREAVSRGKWVAHQPFNGTAGFRINQLYSPWSTLAAVSGEFIAAQKSGNRERKKVWVNTVLGETWKDAGESLEHTALMSRAEPYTPNTVPMGAMVLTAAADVQDDRIEVEIKGWGPREEGWGIEKLILPGDPGLDPVWEDLDKVLGKKYKSELGYEMPIVTMFVDTGGHHTQTVYNWCKARRARRVWPIKGVGGAGKSLIMKPAKDTATRANLLPLGVNAAKEQIFSALSKKKTEPGFQHFPQGYGYDEDHFKQMTSEERHLVYKLGVAYWEWSKKKTAGRNEAWDLAVYNYCALTNLRPNWDALKHAQELMAKDALENRDQKTPTDSTAHDTQEPQSAEPPRQAERRPAPPSNPRLRPPRSGGGWASSWKG
jgi:phage terminase large subunit GpA-like protein